MSAYHRVKSMASMTYHMTHPINTHVAYVAYGGVCLVPLAVNYVILEHNLKF